MIEERFGRFSGTVVSAAIGVGAFGFAIRNTTAKDWAAVGTQIFFTLLAAAVFVGVTPLSLRRMHAKARDVVKEASDIVSECKAFTDKNHADLDAHGAALQSQIVEVERRCETVLLKTLIAANKILEKASGRSGDFCEPMTLENLGIKLPLPSARMEEIKPAAPARRLDQGAERAKRP